MRECGCFSTTTLAQPRRPCRPLHPYAVPRTLLQCVCTRRRNCIGQIVAILGICPRGTPDQPQCLARKPPVGASHHSDHFIPVAIRGVRAARPKKRPQRGAVALRPLQFRRPTGDLGGGPIGASPGTGKTQYGLIQAASAEKVPSTVS
jgi:hypothetical protein